MMRGAGLAQRILYVGGWFASSCSIIFTNKFLLTDRDFHFPFTLAAATNLVVFLGAWVLTRPEAQRPETLSWRTAVTIVGPIGMLTAMDIGVSNWALVHLSVALHTIIRGTVPTFVLCFSLLLGLGRPSWIIAGSILTVCIGIGLAAYGDLECDTLGLALALLSCVFSGLRWAMTQILVQLSPETHASSLTSKQRSPVTPIYYVTPACTLTSASAAWLFEHRALRSLLMREQKAVDFVYTELPVYVIGVGSLIFVLLFCEFALVRLTSSLSVSVLGVAKELVTILVAAATRGDEITPTNVSGFLLCTVGILAYHSNASPARAESYGGGGSNRPGGTMSASGAHNAPPRSDALVDNVAEICGSSGGESGGRPHENQRLLETDGAPYRSP